MNEINQYIFGLSKDSPINLPVTAPDPNSRYSVWVIIIVNRDRTDIDLDYAESIFVSVFDQYKVFMRIGAVTIDDGEDGLTNRKTESLLVVATTKIRKRYSTLVNEIDDYCDDVFRKHCLIQIGRSEVSFLRFKPSNDAVVICSSTKESEYHGNDIQTLNNFANFYPWQKSIYGLIWNEKSKRFKTPDNRSIYWIWDPEGNTGKSLFVKWLCVNRPDEVIKISFVTPNQLRSSLISAGTRICYFIDVPRATNNEDKIENLLSVIEDLKNGYLTTNSYGKYSSLIMEPPHIIIFSNQKCPRSDLSKDRWKSYKINKKTLKLSKTSTFLNK